MHAAKICAKNYANGKNLQVDTTRRSRLPTVNRICQQLSSFARPHAPARSPHVACALPALCPHLPVCA